MYKNKAITKYLEELSAKSPTPGGGSAAALTAALACSLLCMVAQYSDSNKNKKVKLVLKETSSLNRRLIKLIDDDIVAYRRVVLAFEKPKKTKVQLDKRKKAVEKAYQVALGVPYRLSRLCYQGLRLSRKMLKAHNKSLISDTGMSILLFEAAYKSALFNIEINLKSLKNKKLSKKINREFTILNKKVDNLKRKTLEKIGKVL